MLKYIPSRILNVSSGRIRTKMVEEMKRQEPPNSIENSPDRNILISLKPFVNLFLSFSVPPLYIILVLYLIDMVFYYRLQSQRNLGIFELRIIVSSAQWNSAVSRYIYNFRVLNVYNIVYPLRSNHNLTIE